MVVGSRPRYIAPEMTFVDFCTEKGFVASSMNEVDHFQLLIIMDEQQNQQGIEQMNYTTQWNQTDHRFFN